MKIESYIDPEIQKVVKDLEYLLPWDYEIYSEITRQILMFGNVIDMERVKDLIEEKMVTWP